MEITMLIISILSLIASIAVAIVIFLLQIHLEKKSKEELKKINEVIRIRDLENHARIFILYNTNEIEYLPLAQIATAKQSARVISSDGSGKYLHKRKFYQIFNRCEADLQEEIIRQTHFRNYDFLKYDIEKLISYLLDLFQEDANELGILNDNFLYDGAKYFHRAIDSYGNNTEPNRQEIEEGIWIRLSDFIDYKNSKDKEKTYNDLQGSAGGILRKNLKKNEFYSRPDTFKEFKEIHENPPLGWHWESINLSNAEEKICTFFVMEMIRQGVTLISKKKYKHWSLSLDYAIPETYEDLYYATILTLYCLYYEQVKDLEELKIKDAANEQ